MNRGLKMNNIKYVIYCDYCDEKIKSFSESQYKNFKITNKKNIACSNCFDQVIDKKDLIKI